MELARDGEIARALQEKRWADLMNDPRILALARDESLLAEVRGLDLEALFAEVSAPHPPRGGGEAAPSDRAAEASVGPRGRSVGG